MPLKCSRLTSAAQTGQQSESYVYDSVGNRSASHRSPSYSYQPFNKLVSTSTAGYVFDNNGNMVRKTDSAGTWQYYWNAENQLVRVVKPGPGPLSFRTINYKYDALSRRVERQMKRGGSIAFTYDGQDVILDQKSDGTTTTYINGPGIDNKLKQTNSTTGTHYYLHDHLGSTTALTDSSGNVSTQMTYDGYGNTTANSLTRYGYTGRELDADTGLMYYRARWYDPTLGRFVSEDPIGFNGGVNWYGYVGNNPLRNTDPFGLTGQEILPYIPQFLPWIGAAAAAIGGAAASPIAIGIAAYGVTFIGALHAGEWLATRPWNPFVNGPWNPYGVPFNKYPPLRDLSRPRCEIPQGYPPPLIPPMMPSIPLPIPFRAPTPDDGRVVCYRIQDANEKGYCLYMCYSSTGKQRVWVPNTSFSGAGCPPIISY